MQRHKEKTFECHYCNSSFLTEVDLRNHILSYHEQENLNHPCPFCNETYHKKYLKIHIKSKHDGSRSPAIMCQLCDFVTHTKSDLGKRNLIRHNQRRHNN